MVHAWLSSSQVQYLSDKCYCSGNSLFRLRFNIPDHWINEVCYACALLTYLGVLITLWVHMRIGSRKAQVVIHNYLFLPFVVAMRKPLPFQAPPSLSIPSLFKPLPFQAPPISGRGTLPLLMALTHSLLQCHLTKGKEAYSMYGHDMT